MDGIDGSIMNVALPKMAAYFDTDTGTIGGVIITYLLMMAGLLIVFGKFAGRGYAKILFLQGFVIFILGSAAYEIALFLPHCCIMKIGPSHSNTIPTAS